MGHETEQQKLRLYLRMPFKIVDDKKVLELHPAIKRIIRPRQSARWCTLVFDDTDTCLAVKKALKGHKINNKKVYIDFMRQKSSTKCAEPLPEVKQEIKEESD